MPGFWPLTLLLGERASNWQNKRVNRWLTGSALAILTLFLIVLLHLTIGILQKPSQYALWGGFVPPNQDPSREVLDIIQLRQGVAESPEFVAALQEASFVFTNAYYMSGLVDMAIHPLRPIPVTTFSQDQRGFGIWYNSQDWVGKNGLYITTTVHATRPGVTERYRGYFASFEKLGEVPIKRGGVAIDRFYIYQGTNLLKAYP